MAGPEPTTHRGDDAAPHVGQPYRLSDGPRHVTGVAGDELPGHYEVAFSDEGGGIVERYLTDKGRAELLRLIDAGQGTFTREELEWLTTEPTIRALLAAMAGEGAEGG
jgi:hypothetical protein